MAEPLTKALALLLASVGEGGRSLVKRLGTWQGGLAVAAILFTSGMGTGVFVMDLASHEDRILALEQIAGAGAGAERLDSQVVELAEWRVVHVDTVSRPGLRQLERQEEVLDSLSRRMGRAEGLLQCLYYDIPPERCQVAPPGAD